MNQGNYKEAKEVINSLNTGNFCCECPCGCGEEINLRDAGLFYLDDFSDDAYKRYMEMKH